MNVSAFRLLLAQRLENFRARIGEVPAASHAEMAYAVNEVARNVLAVVGLEEDTHNQTPEKNLDSAVAALRGALPLLRGEEDHETLQQIGAAVHELFAGLKAARAPE
jgi:hypothetical protein